MNVAESTLWVTAEAATRVALEVGALQPIETTSQVVVDGGVRFVVRVVGSLRKKDEVRKALTGEGRGKGPVVDPFDPWEEALFVGDLTPTHVALLNKFPVLDRHVLVVTRRFEPQEELLTLEDFRALWCCLAQGEALGFYNGGEAGGASQPHKHLQIVPLPIDEDLSELPIEPLLRPLPPAGAIRSVPSLPFRHLLCRLGPQSWVDPEVGAMAALDLYRQMMLVLGVSATPLARGAKQERPYNLLVTREWMMALPRSAEFAEGISVNAVGFAGGLLVRNEEQLRQIEAVGPMKILKRTGVATSS